MKKISIRLKDIEFQNLQALVVKYTGSVPGYLRYLIAQAFEKEYGGYKGLKTQKIKEINEIDAMSVEQLCEARNGVVKGNTCEFTSKYGNMTQGYPLTDRKGIEKFEWNK